MPAPWTSPEIVEKARAFLAAAGQAPIVMKRELDGFIMNRMQGALLEEAFRLVADGYATVEDVDIGIREGLALAEKTWENIAFRQKNPWNQPDMISSGTGRFLFGDSYMRNMVIWAIPLALAKHNLSIKHMILKLGAGKVRPPL